MQTVFGLHGLNPEWPGSTVCVGVFDGVHLGHQAVIRAAYEDAHTHERPCIVLTFDRHPLSLLRPEKCPKTILAPDLKLGKIAQLGATLAVVVAFDRQFSEQSPEEFLNNVLKGGLRAEAVVVGHDFGFGKDRAGTPQWLRERIPTCIVEPLIVSGRRVSSTEIRQDIAEGKMCEAAALLGAPFALAGIVVPGRRLGRELGVPTANLVPLVDQVIPKDGIYAGHADTPYGRFAAAISIGNRPAVPGAGFAIEAHLLDYPGRDICGRPVSLEIVTRIRDELWFESKEALAEQMRRDIASTRDALEALNA